MNLKSKKKEPWLSQGHLKFIAIYAALAIVLVINQVVFSYILKDRENANAFSNTDIGDVFSVLGNRDVPAGTNNVLVGQFIPPDPWVLGNPGQTCNFRLDDPGNNCLQLVDADGTATEGAGAASDGSKLMFFDWVLPSQPFTVGNFLFHVGDNICTDSYAAPTCVYIDSDGDCNSFTGTQSNILSPGGACATIADNLVAGATTPLWTHTELINNNNAYDYSATLGQSEAIWIRNLDPDDDIVQGSSWDLAFANQWQGDAPGAWTAQDTFYDANTDGIFNGALTEPVFIDKDNDGEYTDVANTVYEADGTATLGAGTNDDVIPDGTVLSPLLPADNVCISTLGLGGIGNIIIYVDGNGDCIPGNGGTDVLVRDDTGTLPLTVSPIPAPGFGTFPYAFISAAQILYYYDADSSVTWSYVNSAATTETLWARLQGLDQWHINKEGATGVIEADGTATIGAGVDDDALTNGAALTYLQPADNMCVSRNAITTAIEDIYIDTSGDCIPGNGGLDTILQDTTADGLNPATSGGFWASGAGTFAYFDGAVAANGVWDWGASAALTESIWIEIYGNEAASSADTNIYSYGTAIAGDPLTQLSAAVGPTSGEPLIYADADGLATLNSTDTILEDNGNVQTGIAGVPNGVIDREIDTLAYFSFLNAGTAVPGAEITNLALYAAGADDICDNPAGSVDDVFVNNFTWTGTEWSLPMIGEFSSLTTGRLCVSMNVSPATPPGRTFILAVPQLVDNNLNGLFETGDNGWFFYSSNDGAIGGNAVLPDTYTITVAPSYGGRTQDTTPPGILTNVNLKADSSGTITLTWQDPTDADLNNIVIDITTAGQTATQTVNKGVQTLIVSGGKAGQEYSFSFRSEDTSGNLSPKQVYSIVIPATGDTVITQPAAGEVLPTPIPPQVILPTNIKIGDLLKDAATKTVYVVGNDGKRHVFPNGATFFTWFNDFSLVKTVGDDILSQLPFGANVTVRPGTKLVKIQTDPNVYAVEPGGIIRAIKSEAIAAELYGTDWAAKIIDVPDVFFVNYVKGPDIAEASYPAGSLIQYLGSSEIYYIDNMLKRLVSAEVFTNNLYNAGFVIKNVAITKVYSLAENQAKLSIADMMMFK
ncbi:MAG: hypothetical protein WC460_04285 [Patescibacteria group bacterium]